MFLYMLRGRINSFCRKSLLKIQHMACRFLLRSDYLTRLCEHLPNLSTKCKHLSNVSIVNKYCTRNFDLNFENSLLQKYIKSLITEYKSLCAESDCHEEATERILELQPVIDIIDERNQLTKNLTSLKELSGMSEEKEFQSSVKEEEELYNQRIKNLENMILSALIPTAAEDNCNDIVLEVSAGVGGQEAMLFAKQLFDMYCNYVSYKDWDFQIAQEDLSEIGGLRHANMLVSGKGAYQYLKFEAGVHRVQRVPATEKSGRVHTSTVAVAVLPQPEEIDIVLHEKDLHIETKRSSGAGGQHVNKTESAVRITHLPTGIVVDCQVDRSQIKNRQIAMQTLKARIYQRETEEQASKSQTTRKQQVGYSMRSDKIRTYNFPQDRITDHRLGSNFHHMESFLLGGEHLNNLLCKLELTRKKDRLLEVLSSAKSL